MSRSEGPEGPYTSPYTGNKHFLIRTMRLDAFVWAVVQNMQQPRDAMFFPDRRSALAFLRENGFVLVKK